MPETVITEDEQAFLKAVEEAGDDVAPRRVYADWLDEHHREDEATYQRNWTPLVAQMEGELKAANARIVELEMANDHACGGCYS